MSFNNLKQTLADKITHMHNYIYRSYYVNHLNFEIRKNDSYNDVILLSLFTGLLKKNQLTVGNYGLGKTSTSQAVTSLLYSVPMEYVEETMLSGTPYLTEEKVIARPNLGALTKEGKEEAIFSMFANAPHCKIIDEINRTKAGTQNLLLTSVESGLFKYLNDALNQEKYAFFATSNYPDGGNGELIAPLRDRFDVSVEVVYPLMLGDYVREEIIPDKLSSSQKSELEKLSNDYTHKFLQCQKDFDDGKISYKDSTKRLHDLEKSYKLNRQNIAKIPSISLERYKLKQKDIAIKLSELLADVSKSYEKKFDSFQNYSNLFRKHKLNEAKSRSDEEYNSMNNILLNPIQRESVSRVVDMQYFSEEASVLFDMFLDHLNSKTKVKGETKPIKTGKKEHVDKTENNISSRTNMRGKEYIKLLSILKGEEQVSYNTVRQMMPYLINHKIEFNNHFKITPEEYSTCSTKMEKTIRFVDNFVKEYYGKQKRNDYINLYREIRSNKPIKEILKSHSTSKDPIILSLKSIYDRKRKHK